MSMKAFWRYLLSGSEEMVLSKTWRESPLIRQHVAYTMRQLQQGCVVKDVAAMRREAFWQAIEAKREQPKTLKVVSGRFQ